MNVLSNVTLSTLKRNKTRTIITMLGIILSVALITAIMVFSESLQQFMVADAKNINGTWHISDYYEISELSAFDENDDIKSYGFSQCLGYAYDESVYPYLGIVGMGGNYSELLSVDLNAGRMPENSSEIILPLRINYYSDTPYIIGQTISLDVGSRYFNDAPIDNQLSAYVYDNEYLDGFETKNYTIVGFYERASYDYEPFFRYDALTVLDENNTNASECKAYLELSNPEHYRSFFTENYVDNTDRKVNYELMTALGIGERYGFREAFDGFVLVLVLLVVISSVILIYNTFSISVYASERTKEFGILLSVGSTKRQLRTMVMYEALFLCMICIPLGLALGLSAITIVVKLLGEKFSIFAYDINNTVLQLNITPFSVIVPCVVSVLTVFISAYIPAKSVTKRSAIDAIRQHKRKKPAKRVKEAPWFVGKIFGMPGIIGYKYYKRNRKKYTTTILSLSASIIMFVASATFIDDGVMYTESDTSNYSYDFAYMLSPSDFSDTEIKNTKKIFESIDTVSDVAYIQYDTTASTTLQEDMLIEYLHRDDIYYDYEITEDGIKFPSTIILVEDFWFEKMLEDNELERDEFFDTENIKAIFFNDNDIYDSESGSLNKILKEDAGKITVSYEYYPPFIYEDDNKSNGIADRFKNMVINYISDMLLVNFDVYIDDLLIVSKSINLEVGSVIDSLPFYLDSYEISGFAYFFPLSLRDSVFTSPYYFDSCTYRLTSTDNQMTEKTLYEYLGDGILSEGYIYNNAAIGQQTVNLIIIIKVLAYGFIIIMSLISIANAFNTISTNFILRSREFAILKSVGMSDSDIRKLLNFECLLYGTKAFLISIPISVLISVLIHYGVDINAFFISGTTIGAILFSALVVFSVVFVTMIYSIRKMKPQNIIDALRNENY